MNTTIDLTDASFAQAAPIRTASPSYQAFLILQIGFVAAPILFGVDKFFHVLVNWDQYLPAIVARLSPIGGHTPMLILRLLAVRPPTRVACEARPGPRWCWVSRDHRQRRPSLQGRRL